MNIQTKTANSWTPFRLGLLVGLIGIGVSLESSAQPPTNLLEKRLTISNVTVSEPVFRCGHVIAKLTVTLDRGIKHVFSEFAQPVYVDYETLDGSAKKNLDYEPVYPPKTLIFEGQETTKEIRVDVKGDAVSEGNEDFIVQLSNPQGAVLADGEGQITINNTPGEACAPPPCKGPHCNGPNPSE